MENETRQTTEYKIYVLTLADMHGGVDRSHPVAVFSTHQKLKDFYHSQLADSPYTDGPSADNYGQTHSWHKVFKKGSMLEWYNGADSLEVSRDVSFGGVFEDWVKVFPNSSNFNVPYNPI